MSAKDCAGAAAKATICPSTPGQRPPLKSEPAAIAAQGIDLLLGDRTVVIRVGLREQRAARRVQAPALVPGPDPAYRGASYDGSTSDNAAVDCSSSPSFPSFRL